MVLVKCYNLPIEFSYTSLKYFQHNGNTLISILSSSSYYLILMREVYMGSFNSTLFVKIISGVERECCSNIQSDFWNTYADFCGLNTCVIVAYWLGLYLSRAMKIFGRSEDKFARETGSYSNDLFPCDFDFAIDLISSLKFAVVVVCIFAR